MPNRLMVMNKLWVTITKVEPVKTLRSRLLSLNNLFHIKIQFFAKFNKIVRQGSCYVKNMIITYLHNSWAFV